MKIIKCTREYPYSQDRDKPGTRWEHINAIEVGDQEDGYPGGDIQKFRCPTCGMEWEQELPQ